MNIDRLMLESAQEDLDRKLNHFKSKKVSELKELLEINNKDNKASFVNLARKMMNINGNQLELGEGKVDSVLKTVRLTGMKKPAEAMSFMPVDFDDWINTLDWKDSYLYKYFSEKTLVFFIFQQYPSGKRVDDSEMTFIDAKVWKMSEYDLNHGLREIWDEVRNLIICNKLEIVETVQKDGKIVNKNNLPSSKFNSLGHLRPGGKNGSDKIKLPTGQSIAKQRFWFNAEYVKEILDI
jgi:hypothetical protein